MNQYHNPEDCGPDEYSWRNEYAREHQCKDPECSPETVHFHGSAYTSLATEETILDGLANYRAKRKIAWVWSKF